MMSVAQHIMAQAGFGKLLFKTTSTDADWSIYRISSSIPCEYTVIDNANNTIVKQGEFTSAYNSMNADLSLGSGDYSVFAKIEDATISQFYSYKHISWLDMSLLPNVYILYIFNSNNDIEVNGSLDNITHFETKQANLIGFDFSTNTKMINFQNKGAITTDTPLVIDQAKSLVALRLDTNMQLASFDTIGMNNITYINVKSNPIVSLNLDNLTSLVSLTLQYLADLITFTFTQQKPSLQYIKIWTIPNGINNFDLSLAPNVYYVNLRSIHLQNIIIDNPSLETLYLGYNELTDLVIPNNTTAIKYLHIYANSSLNTLTKPHLPNLTYVNIGGYNHVQEFDFSGSPLLNTIICNHANFRKMNLKNGNTNAIANLVHTYYADCCFLVDDENDPVVQAWTLRDNDVLTSDQATYDNF